MQKKDQGAARLERSTSWKPSEGAGDDLELLRLAMVVEGKGEKWGRTPSVSPISETLSERSIAVRSKSRASVPEAQPRGTAENLQK